jgi:hypothetical protein
MDLPKYDTKEANPRTESTDRSYEKGEGQPANQGASNSLYGSGNYYVQSTRQMLLSKRNKLLMELDMVNTAIDNCSEEVDKMIVVRECLHKLGMITRP